MDSILQQNQSICYLCGQPAGYADPLDKHHIFGGALRKKSEEEGLWVKLHHFKCHQFGPEAVHQNAAVRQDLQAQAQLAWMDENGKSIEDFRMLFYKSYV